MKQILCIFTLCTLLALGFTACQTEDPLTLEQQQQEMKKRDSKKHPKLEYITTVENNGGRDIGKNHASKLKYNLESDNDSLKIFFQIDSDEEISVYITDPSGKRVIEEITKDFSKGKNYEIKPAMNYPYRFVISSDNFALYGRITLE